jgi:TonB family protein
MKYSLSALVGFFVALMISLPLQQLNKLRSDKSTNTGSLRSKAFGRSHDLNGGDLVLAVPALTGDRADPKEPSIKFLPHYPSEAANRKIEGHVLLSFRIAEDGLVQNLQVVESQPPLVFDEAAKGAVARWVYQSRSDSGSKLKRSAEQRLRLNFNLKKALAAESNGRSSL